MQGIEFQIVNDSAEASKGLDELSASLNKLKSNLGGAGTSLNNTAAGITSIKNALNKMNTGNFESQLQRINKGLGTLNTKTAGLKISSSIGNQLREIGNSLNAMPDTAQSKLNSLAEGLKPLGELGKQQIGPFLTQLKKLPDIINDLQAADIDKFTQQMKDLATAMKPFADEMQKVSNGFSAFPSRIQRLVKSTEQYNGTVKKAATHTNAWGAALKTLSIGAVFRTVSKLLASAINKSNQYTETLNMFTVSMGEYAQEAYEYAQKVSDVMGIDPSTWMENQGVFNSIITGFGVAGDKAAIMSKNLTQLAYDLSSFYNTDITSAMQKVQSGISGELEPLRRLGYDLSVARLQQEAYNLGIDKSVSSMTQAEKTQLRYHAMLTQVIQVQGDMARTLQEPANQLRVLKAQVEQAARAFGNIFIPILNAALPVVIAVASAVREIVSAIAALFGIQMADSVDWGDSLGSAAGATGDIADNMDSAAGSAKELKKYLAGFDELNVLPDQNSGGSGSGAGGGGSGFDIEPIDYDFLGGAVTERIDAIKAKLQPFVDWIKDNLEEIKDTAIGIGGILGGWAISSSVISAVKKISSAFKAISSIGGGTGFLAIAGVMADVNRFIDYMNDISENGADFSNVSGAISELAGIAGDLAVLSGYTEIGGALKVIQGIGEIVSACADMANNGVNWDNMSTIVIGISNIIIGIGFISKNWSMVGAGFSLQGLTTIITELKDNWDAIKQGDWSGVDKVTLAIGAIELIGGIAVAIKNLNGSGIVAVGAMIGTVGTAIIAISSFVVAIGAFINAINLANDTTYTDMSSMNQTMGLLGVASLGAGIAAGSILGLGPVAGVIAGISVAAAGFAAAMSTDAIPAMELFDDTISKTTKEKVEPFMESIWDLGATLSGLEYGGQIITDSVVSEVKEKVHNISETILNELDCDRNASLATLEPLRAALGEEAYQELLKDNDAYYDTITAEIKQGESRINEIMAEAKSEGRSITANEWDEINRIQSEMQDAGLIHLSESAVEHQKILNNLNDAATRISLDQASNIIKNAQKTRDETIDAAQTQYAKIELEAKRMLDVGAIDEEQYKLIMDAAAETRDTTIADAKTQYQTIYDTATDKLGDTARYIDSKTGEIKSKWEVFCDEFHKEWEKNWDNFSKNLKEGWDGLKQGVSDMWDGLKNLYTSEIAPVFTQEYWEERFTTIADAFKESIKSGINGAITQLNKFIDWVNGKLHIKFDGLTIAGKQIVAPFSRQLFTLPKIMFKDGGFPETGQLFIAREAGAEMVGSIGNRTAVANNDQIVEGITAGVSNGNNNLINVVYAVSRQVIQAINEKDSDIYLDDARVGRAVTQSQSRQSRMYGR